MQNVLLQMGLVLLNFDKTTTILKLKLRMYYILIFKAFCYCKSYNSPLVEEEEKNGKGQTCPLYSSIRKNYDNIISSQGIQNYSQKKKNVNDNDSFIAPLNVITEEVSSNQNEKYICRVG